VGLGTSKSANSNLHRWMKTHGEKAASRLLRQENDDENRTILWFDPLFVTSLLTIMKNARFSAKNTHAAGMVLTSVSGCSFINS
jgi:hypothetical protein